MRIQRIWNNIMTRPREKMRPGRFIQATAISWK